MNFFFDFNFINFHSLEKFLTNLMARTKQTPRVRRRRGHGRGLPVARKEGNSNGNGNESGHGTGTPPGHFVQPSSSDNKPDPPVQKRKKQYVRAVQHIRQLQRTTKLCISKYQFTRSVS